MMFNYLTLLAGVELPFPELQVSLNQPTIKEIAIIGEDRFYSCLSLFRVDKERILNNAEKIEDEEQRIEAKSRISNMSNFEILMEMVNSDPSLKYDLEIILLLVLPQFTFAIEERLIIAMSATREQPLLITNENFDIFADAILAIFGVKDMETSEEEFKPENEAARLIAEKIKKGREKVKELKGDANENISILGTYVSSLGIGSNSLNLLNGLDLTVYQIMDQMKRYGLWSQYQQSLRAAMAGAKDVELIDWLKSF